MDPIKEAFKKIREDMNYFHQQIEEIKRTLEELKPNQTQSSTNQAVQHETPTHKEIPTDDTPPEALKEPISEISTGNQGVPTDRQTNQQTNRHIQKFALNREITQQTSTLDHLQRASEILESLDELKKEVRFKFKRLTNQEMLIFTTIYQLEEQKIEVNYAVVSRKLHLSESSVRDYVGKIVKKGVPIRKIKQDNKKVMLSISPELKKIASINTILQLREL